MKVGPLLSTLFFRRLPLRIAEKQFACTVVDHGPSRVEGIRSEQAIHGSIPVLLDGLIKRRQAMITNTNRTHAVWSNFQKIHHGMSPHHFVLPLAAGGFIEPLEMEPFHTEFCRGM